MRTSRSWLAYGLSLVILAVVAGIIARANREAARKQRDAAVQAVAGEVAAVTSREGLTQRIAQMEGRLRERPTDGAAAVSLADALLREARVSGNAGLALRAEEALKG